MSQITTSIMNIGPAGPVLSISGNDALQVVPDGAGNISLLATGVLDTARTGASEETISLTAATDGQLIIGSTGVDAVWGNLASAGGTIAITEGAGTINLEATNMGFTWSVETTTPIALVEQHGYFANRVGQIVFNLPAVAAVGDTFIVSGISAGGDWLIQCGAGQTVFVGNEVTSAGGTIESASIGDNITIVCWQANTGFAAISFNGNFEVL